ncbi:zinc finger protein 85-like [Saccostrea echinata]|uniref:zinc finger protein 85-like n=1 Tax=Saccostrea echinata TaxID=191078 RepID=UPI002A7EA817|nr:zinc finger protein 85-like [Saccostrea echinata]
METKYKMDEIGSSISSLCSMLETADHASIVLSLDPKNQKIYHCSSGVGRNFLLVNRNTVKSFISFCTDTYAADKIVYEENQEEDTSRLVINDIETFLHGNLEDTDRECKNNKISSEADNVSDFDPSETFEDEQDSSSTEQLSKEENSNNKAPMCNNIPEKSKDKVISVKNDVCSPRSLDVKKGVQNNSKERSGGLQDTEKNDDVRIVLRSELKRKGKNLRRSGQKGSKYDKIIQGDEINNQNKQTREKLGRRAELVEKRRKRENATEENEECGNGKTEEKGKLSGHNCLFCDKQLKSRKTLMRHVVIHAGKKLRCKICDIVCNKRDILQKHISVHDFQSRKPALETRRKSSSKPECSINTKNDMNVENGINEVESRTCKLCQVQFSSVFSLKRHMKCHENLKIFKCYVCSENFRTEKELSAHTAIHKVSLVYSCGTCRHGFDSEEALQYHKEKNSCSAPEVPEETSFNCSICDKVFAYQKNFEKHLEMHKNNQVSCSNKELTVSENMAEISVEHSGMSVPSSELSELSLHYVQQDMETGSSRFECTNVEQESASKINTSSDIPTSASQSDKSSNDLACNLCGQIFKKAMALYRHKMEHDDTGMFPCRFCNFVTNSKDSLTRHAKKHLAQLPHICDICGKGFTEKCHLTFHMNSHSNDRHYLCDDCGKSFRARQSLAAHKRSHLGARPFKCKYCDLAFITGSGKKEHEKIHLNKKTYMCDSCGMSFNQRCGLYTHKLTHHNDKPAKICPECGRAFKTEHYLRSHFVSRHLKLEDVNSYGFKVYTCEVCQKLFSDKSDLKSHMNKHTGEKPFKCAYCNKGFSDRSNMRAHQRIHQEVRPHLCNICGKGFIFNRDLKKHLRSHSPQADDTDRLQESAAAVEFLRSSLNTDDAETVEVQNTNTIGEFEVHANISQDYMYK